MGVLTADDVAALTRFATSYVYSLARKWQKGDRKHGMPCHKVGRSVRFFSDEIEEWLRSN